MIESRYRSVVAVLVVMNVFLVGVLAGGAYVLVNYGRHTANSMLPLDVEQLPDAEQRAFQAILLANGRDSQTILQDRERARTEAGSLLSMPMFDKEALSAAFARVRGDDLALRTRVDQLAVEFAAQLPAKDRVLLARAFPQRGKQRPPSAAKE